MATKKKIVVLGGGLGSMSAAFWLTSTAALRERHEVTVLQHGWRLGGKGASGRNADHADRIEEHGLHMFMGFYDNAFHTLRLAFDEWQRPAGHPWASISDAFSPQNLITLEERVGGAYETWNLTTPMLPGMPGDDFDDDAADVRSRRHVRNVLTWIEHSFAELPGGEALAPLRAGLDRALRAALDHGIVASALAFIVKELLAMARLVDQALSSRLPNEPLLRRALYLAELFLAALHGWLVDVLPNEAPDVDAWMPLNTEELRAYLQRHGCPEHVANWVVIKALYDLGFAYVGGDASTLNNGNIAAGVGLKILLRIPFAYKGAPLWRMHAGMGDTVFTPLFQVCRQRGVDVRFFHRATKVHLAADGRTVEAIDVDVQAEMAVPGRSYRPLVDVHGLGCWPSAPLWEQLAPGTPRVDFESPSTTVHVRTERWQRGVHFDDVVLGVSKASLPTLCADIIAKKPRWRAMIDAVPTTATQAAQLWFKPTTKDLGFDAGATVMTGYAEPFDSWADMSDLIAVENWGTQPADEQPQSLQYLCSPMKDAGITDPKAHVTTLTEQWLQTRAGHLWPATTSGAVGFAWSLLVDSERRDGPARLQAQYIRANTEGSERYVQSFANTIAQRLRADTSSAGSDVDNLYLAGDWVITGLNAGSAEAAVEGGMLASKALCGVPDHVADADGA